MRLAAMLVYLMKYCQTLRLAFTSLQFLPPTLLQRLCIADGQRDEGVRREACSAISLAIFTP